MDEMDPMDEMDEMDEMDGVTGRWIGWSLAFGGAVRRFRVNLLPERRPVEGTLFDWRQPWPPPYAPASSSFAFTALSISP